MKNFLALLMPILIFLACTEQKKEEVKTEVQKPAQQTIKPIDDLKQEIDIDQQDRESTIHFYFTPSVDEKVVLEYGQKLLDYLEKETNTNIEIHVTKNYEDMISDFGNGKADVGFMNSLSYIKANEEFGVTAKLRAIRYGKPVYYGQIIANANTNIKSLKDLNGKTIAYTDISSTSGYLFPQKIIKNEGIKVGKTIFAGKHDTVVKMVYEGIVDAGATFYSEPAKDGTIRDARARLIDKYPDVEEKVIILSITDPIPNDPIVFRKDIPNKIAYDISLGLIKYMSTDEGKEVMMALYGTNGFERCTDSEYDILREALMD